MREYHVASISSKGQVTIPKAIRVQLGMMPGDRLSVIVEDGVIVLAPIGSSVIETAGSPAKATQRGR